MIARINLLFLLKTRAFFTQSQNVGFEFKKHQSNSETISLTNNWIYSRFISFDVFLVECLQFSKVGSGTRCSILFTKLPFLLNVNSV